MTKKYSTANHQETFKLGQDLAKKLKGGEVVALTGDLGGGKTWFTKGVAIDLEIDPDYIVSPTFTLVNEYKNVGNYEIEFDAGKLASGIYFYTLKTAQFNSTKKLILLK